MYKKTLRPISSDLVIVCYHQLGILLLGSLCLLVFLNQLFCTCGAVGEYLRNSKENSPLPWVEALKEVEKPNIEFKEHSAVTVKSSGPLTVSLIIPPNLLINPTTLPWNSFGAVTSTDMIGSKMTGCAFKKACLNAP